MMQKLETERKRAIQDFYPEDVGICYGCGPKNPDGLQLKTYWNGAEGICRFLPRPRDTAFPGYVYGGLIANLIDCHSIGTAIAEAYQRGGRLPGSEPAITFVTGTLSIRYIEPTPMGVELLLKARIKEHHEKKSIVVCTVYAGEVACVVGEVIAVRAPWGQAASE